MTLKLALIGAGGLGGALARGLGARQGFALTLADLDCAKAEATASAAGAAVAVAASAADAARGADVAVLAVKPPHMAAAVGTVAPELAPGGLVVSCAAGVPFCALEAGCKEAALARAMPNVGAAVGASTTAVVLGPGCEESRDTERLEAIFGAVGEVRRVRNEALLHPITALSGSGPAFVLLALEAMEDAGVAAGLSREDARFFARGAFTAAARLAAEEPIEPAALRARITSPGGTTIAGLVALEERAARGAFLAAVAAATEWSKALG